MAAFEARKGRIGRQSAAAMPAAMSSDGKNMRAAHLVNLPRLEAVPVQDAVLDVYRFESARPEPQAPVQMLMAKLSINGRKPFTASVVLDRDDLSYIEAVGGIELAPKLHRKLEQAIALALVNRARYVGLVGLFNSET